MSGYRTPSHVCAACGRSWVGAHHCVVGSIGVVIVQDKTDPRDAEIARMLDAKGWLIESSPGIYLGVGRGLAFDWCPPIRALWFARREDAEGARKAIADICPRDMADRLRAAKVVNHAWEAPDAT